MAVRTRPVRVFENDLPPIRLLAEMQQHGSPADVIHVAVAEYIYNHREELGRVFSESQRAIAAGDLDAVSALLSPGAERLTDELSDDLDKYR
jgi:hypothetical protein